MATLEQIAEALRRADAAGNAEDARRLAQMYRDTQAQAAKVSAAGPASVPDTPPEGAKPGSKAYADWAMARVKAGKDVPQVSSAPPETVRHPDLVESTLATINGLTSSVPFLTETSDALIAAGQTAGDVATGKPVDFGAKYDAIRDRRREIAEAAPIADMAGKVGGILAGTGAIGASKAGAEALGMSGPFMKQLFNSVLSTGAYEGLSGLSKGHTGVDLLTDIGIGGAGGAGGALVGKAVEGTGQAIANSLTSGAQNKIVKEALANGAPDAAALRKEGSGYFQSSVDDNPVMITSDAYHRLLSNIQRSTLRFRPNELNNPQAVGVLNKFWQIADDLNSPGSNAVVDLKDLHILRQAASEVAEDAPSAQSREIARKTVNQLDRFIKTLSPEDTLAGVDPAVDAENLMNGISTWARASKVKKIEAAIDAADTYRSGFENGLKQQFLKLMKSPEFKTFSKVEQDAIRKVAHGSAGQNVAEAIGKLGFSLGGHGTNVIGAGAGTAALATALSPVMSPVLAVPTALATTTAAGAIGRRAAEHIGRGAAERAANIAATPGIKTAAQRPNVLAPASVPLSTLIKITSALANDQE